MPYIEYPKGRAAVVLSLWMLVGVNSLAQSLPTTDERSKTVRDTNTKRAFPVIASEAEWKQRTVGLVNQVLVSCGLYPPPPRGPLRVEIWDKVERGDYSVEKVVFQPYPGFYLAGNLYRPLGKGNGPFPGVLNPHGHWREGRMADNADGSIAARCINFAKDGMVAFSYDMVGYNDTIQVDHKFASQPTNQLWNISLMGLQTWNSVRALDFLMTLPEVDRNRLACTGESGGGTQTFMLGVVDTRLAVQAPIVMVSHSMQGGCLCENAPGLRVEYSNMELAAVAAPRPQIIVAATGDWTRATLTVEGPAIAGIYKLLKAEENFKYTLHNYNHNYNKTSREDVYGWFGKFLNRRGNGEPKPEQAFTKEPDLELRAYPDGKPPEGALRADELAQSLVKIAQKKFAELQPTNEASLTQYKRVLVPAWRHTLQLDAPHPADLIREPGKEGTTDGMKWREFALGRKGRGDRIEAVEWQPGSPTGAKKTTVVLVHPRGKAAFQEDGGELQALVRSLTGKGYRVVGFDQYSTGPRNRDPFANYFTTYNRTVAQERAQDLLTLAAQILKESREQKIVLVGFGSAGPLCLLAAPVADAVVADADGLDAMSDAKLLEPDYFFPGIRRYGAFEGFAALAAPNPLLVHNTAGKFSTGLLEKVYAAADRTQAMRAMQALAGDTELTAWIESQETGGIRMNDAPR